MNAEKLTWGDIEKLCERLAWRIRKDGFVPDVIVGVGRGGWIPARLLSDMLGVEELYSIGVKYYSGIGRRRKKPILTQDFPGSARGKRILVVDDIAHTGRTLQLVRERLAGAREVRIATLHMKHHSRLKPEYCAKATNAWLEYPVGEQRDETRARASARR